MRAAQQTLPLVADPKITRAQVERRTGIFRVGIDLAGGWRNRAFADVRSGVPGRVTIVDGRVKEINVVTERRSVIAVPPKRPPKPGGTPR